MKWFPRKAAKVKQSKKVVAEGELVREKTNAQGIGWRKA